MLANDGLSSSRDAYSGQLRERVYSGVGRMIAVAFQQGKKEGLA